MKKYYTKGISKFGMPYEIWYEDEIMVLSRSLINDSSGIKMEIKIPNNTSLKQLEEIAKIYKANHDKNMKEIVIDLLNN